VNPGSRDPGIQNQERSVLTIARLRDENAQLRKDVEDATMARDAAMEETDALRTSLEQLAREHREVFDDVQTLRAMLQDVDKRARHLRVHFESLGVSFYRPFDASQAPLFPSEFGHSSRQHQDGASG
jgi:hypothetical protein